MFRPNISGGFLGLVVVILATASVIGFGSFQFLTNPTGWQLGFSVIPQQPIDPYWKTIAISVGNTVLLSGSAITIATIIGCIAALMASGKNPFFSRLAKTYVQIFRNIPLLLQALFWFAVVTHSPGPRKALHFAGLTVSNRGLDIPFFTSSGMILLFSIVMVSAFSIILLRRFQRVKLSIQFTVASMAVIVAIGIFYLTEFGDAPLLSRPELTGFGFEGGISLPTEFLAILIALSIFGSAYITEIVRGGLATVPVGIIEAAKALGLPAWVTEVKIRAPIAFRALLLPLGSQYTILIKATSIGLAVGYTDLFAVTLMAINQSGHTIAFLCVMTICFVILNQIVVAFFNFLNKSFKIPSYELE